MFPLFLLDIGGSKSDSGILMGVMSLSAVGMRPWISGLVDRIGHKAALSLGCVILSGVSIAHFYSVALINSVFYFLVLLRFVYGIGLGFIIVASLTFATDLVPPKG
ncbi:MAG: MFS transporter [Desulfamplus sp.]|nr:MFS transporter [Desulfamplus sp.]